MAMITILSSDRNTGDLELSDKGFSHVDKGGPVTWKLGRDCGVSAITAITKKSTPPSQDIFSQEPRRDGSSTNWKATVSKTAATGAEYIYSIYWEDLDGGTPPPYDPKLKVNP
ncbi:hypothetical protein [Flavihumibacter fluvii]|uniref:hypothetical protein n=1 Tax=Flavihumibacter fluvii TaxID=2838157 RepID=UPI001BDEE49B|nr:hypothetical protein [Flavihumibacter fluvii]ULQ50904.1 hypothetical protein KJS93_12500 [Flavihumibacter fluvii]